MITKLLALFLSILILGAFSDDTNTEEVTVGSGDPATNDIKEEEIIISSPDVEVAAVFPDLPDRKIELGTIAELFLGFANNGQKRFNVTAIEASFNYPPDLSVFVQNFTKFPFGIIVEPYEQVSFSYKFYPDVMLEPRDFRLVAHVYYTDEDRVNYTTTFFNDTVFLMEAENVSNFDSFFIYTLGLGLLGLAGYWAYNRFFTNSRRRKDAGGSKAGLGSEWLHGTNLQEQPKRLPSKSPKTKKKNK
eukprot:TRINITY_DN2394_c0_g1_i1.p1 TRINITY_DN2394_c0_g1~~TRINITY_DN2394_c0_g1_i1.p1  ORF type:complete len:246 (+),score=42.08 TRINITY_DN2394_c0_g1_i1:105-842(+)